MRLDIFLKESGFVSSRTKAQELIINNFILVDGVICSNLKKEVSEKNIINILENEEMNYVSRSYKKLKAGLECFDIKVEDKVCLDIGSSTGGFTQVLLENNVKKVFSVDVGTDQFDKNLLEKYKDKIRLFEKTDIRNFGKEEGDLENIYKNFFDIVVCDISFISITKIAENIFELLKEGGVGVILIKPQFEVGKGNIGKGGLVKSEKLSYEELINITTSNIKIEFEKNNLKVINVVDSPILGGDGNKEFLMHIQK